MTTDEEFVESMIELKEGFIQNEDGSWVFVDRREMPEPTTYGSNFRSNCSREANVGQESG